MLPRHFWLDDNSNPLLFLLPWLKGGLASLFWRPFLHGLCVPVLISCTFLCSGVVYRYFKTCQYQLNEEGLQPCAGAERQI